MKKPWGRPPKVLSKIWVTLDECDKRLFDQLCHVMDVSHSELLHILLTGSLQMAKEINDRDMEAAR